MSSSIVILLVIIISVFSFIILIMTLAARARFDAIKDLIPDVTLYNYKDPLTSHLHVGVVVILSIIILCYFLTICYFGIKKMIKNVHKIDVIIFFEEVCYFLLGLGIFVGIISGMAYGIKAIINAVQSQPVPQLMTSQLNLISLLS